MLSVIHKLPQTRTLLCTSLLEAYHVPCAYRSILRSNKSKRKPPPPKPKHTLQRAQPPPGAPDQEAERFRRTAAERRKAKYGDEPQVRLKTPKDKSKHALRVEAKRLKEAEEEELAKQQSARGEVVEQEEEKPERFFTEPSKNAHIELKSKNKAQLKPPSMSTFYPRRGYTYGDRTVLHVKAGNGGSGAVSFATGKFIRTAAADGGRGGTGGSVILQADPSMQEIVLDRRQFAKNGLGGQGHGSSGKNGEDLVLHVPVGTLIRELHKQIVVSEEDGQEYEEWVRGDVIVDLNSRTDRVVIAKGGRGGKGNASYMSSTNKSPKTKELGLIGEEKILELELKTMADVGFVGFPNAGKSTLLSRLSNATPKIMPYPFTTKAPNVGILDVNEFKRITLADLPGIILGANEDKGLGIEFLRHIERTKVLCYVIDMAGTERKYPWRDYFTLQSEVSQYNPKLLWRPTIILANKMDLPEAHANLVVFKEKLKAKAKADRRIVPPIYAITAKSGMDLNPVVQALARMVPDPTLPPKKISVYGEEE